MSNLSKSPIFQITRCCLMYTSIRPSLQTKMMSAMEDKVVRDDVKHYVLHPVARRIERFMPDDGEDIPEEMLENWKEVRKNIEYYCSFEKTETAGVITSTLDLMTFVFADLNAYDLIDSADARDAEALQLQLCYLRNPDSLVRLAEGHAYFNAESTNFKGESGDFIYRMKHYCPQHIQWLRDPGTLAEAMHNAGGEKKFQATVAAALEKPAPDEFHAALKILLQAVTEYVPEDPPINDFSELEAGTWIGLVDITECMRSRLK